MVGGGITGLASAIMLKQSGLKVAVIEAAQILQGTTGHTTGKITAQHSIIYSIIKANMNQEAAKQYADANMAAILAMDELIRQHQIECDFSWQSAYVYTQDNKEIQTIQNEAKIAADLGFVSTYLEEIPLPFDVKAALRFDNQAQFHPLKFLLAVANLIPGNGSYIFENTKAIGIQEGNGYAITTSTGFKVKAPKVIIASHYPFYDGNGKYYSRIHPFRSYAVGVTAKVKYPGGIYITAENPGRSFRSTPLPDGRKLILLVGEHHNTGESTDTRTHYQNLIGTASSVFQMEELLYHWSAQDYTTLDQVPYIGKLSDSSPDIYVATGFRKWGISTAVAAALILKDYINGITNPCAPVFDPTRFKPDANTDNIMTQKRSFSIDLTASKLTPTLSIGDIKPGEAQVFEINGTKRGAFRDQEGRYHLVDLVCTHMGCEPQWNSAEQSWDCPCHGSRFSYDGDVLEGPAKEPLANPVITDNL